MMGRKLLMTLLAAGAIGGFAHGFSQMHHWRDWREQQRKAMMQEFAKTCVDAASARH